MASRTDCLLLPRKWSDERWLRLRSVKRSASASPATGSAKAHKLEQKTLLSLAFNTTATGGSTTATATDGAEGNSISEGSGAS